jgi:heme A synthase
MWKSIAWAVSTSDAAMSCSSSPACGLGRQTPMTSLGQEDEQGR